MFEGWDSFYLLIGGAGGALIGLLFVVATVARRGEAGDIMRAIEAYMTPIVFHLALILGASAMLTAPRLPASLQGALLAGAALLGVASAGHIILRLLGPVKAPHWSDLWCYGVGPLLAYLALGLGAAAVLTGHAWAARIVAAALLTQLLVAVRNAWDLVTWVSVKMRPEDAQG